ncbi:MAG: class II fructose-bisphosphatase [Caldilineales bacterium]|nr:class II fructose-bisphosphatase [Caldilineales bacterium]
METHLERNLGLELVRVTEASALAAGRWMGLGSREGAGRAATEAVIRTLRTVSMAGVIVVGEETRIGVHSPVDTNQPVGNGQGPEMDVVVDPIDGTTLLVQGRSGAISVVGAAPRGSMWAPAPAAYMEKIVVDRDVAPALVPECLDAPAAWTLALVARIKKKEVRDLVVFVLDRPRHRHLIEEIRAAGARVALRTDGDIAGAILAALPGTSIDLLLGIGGVAEGVTAACAVRALGGCMLGRLAPQSPEERAAVAAAGLDLDRILTCKEIVRSDEIFFAATGIADGPLLDGVRYQSGRASTHSLVLRGETGTLRRIYAEHNISD